MEMAIGIQKIWILLLSSGFFIYLILNNLSSIQAPFFFHLQNWDKGIEESSYEVKIN